MLIKEIEIKDILGCRLVHLKFHRSNQSSAIYVVQSPPTCPMRQAFCIAVQLICSSKYASIQSLTQFKDLQRGSIKLVLLIPSVGGATTQPTTFDSDCTPTTSQQSFRRPQRHRKCKRVNHTTTRRQLVRKVDAYRDFKSNTEIITYSVNGGPQRTCTPAEFHAKYLTNVHYILPTLNQLKLENVFNCNGNWFKFLSTELNKKPQKEKLRNLLERFTQLFMKDNLSVDNLLAQLTTFCLSGDVAMTVMQKAYICKVFQYVRSIFEFITCNEYTVWFLILYQGKLIDIQNIIMENLDFNNVKTCIQLKTKDMSREYLWTDSEHVIQDLLLIAFEMAFAFYCKQRIIYLQNLDRLKDHQTVQLAIAACMKKSGCDNIVLNSKNYLQRIIDVCNNLNITAIIEYSGALPQSLGNAYLIKCYRRNDSLKEWDMKLLNEENAEDIADNVVVDTIVNCIDESLKS